MCLLIRDKLPKIKDWQERTNNMFRCFFPDEYLDSAYVIDYDRLYQEGYRGLLFDIDNTLVPHGAPADERAIALFRHLRELGFRSCFLSNNQRFCRIWPDIYELFSHFRFFLCNPPGIVVC